MGSAKTFPMILRSADSDVDLRINRAITGALAHTGDNLTPRPPVCFADPLLLHR